jgi:hypothetical protein
MVLAPGSFSGAVKAALSCFFFVCFLDVALCGKVCISWEESMGYRSAQTLADGSMLHDLYFLQSLSLLLTSYLHPLSLRL